jgi:hypothetical protein
MTSTSEGILVKCPGGGRVHEDGCRASVNLMPGDFDDDYPDACPVPPARIVDIGETLIFSLSVRKGCSFCRKIIRIT